jgi:hypothetical protein
MRVNNPPGSPQKNMKGKANRSAAGNAACV